MCFAKYVEKPFLFVFLLLLLCLRPLWAQAPNLSPGKEEKQGITVTNKMTK